MEVDLCCLSVRMSVWEVFEVAVDQKNGPLWVSLSRVFYSNAGKWLWLGDWVGFPFCCLYLFREIPATLHLPTCLSVQRLFKGWMPAEMSGFVHVGFRWIWYLQDLSSHLWSDFFSVFLCVASVSTDGVTWQDKDRLCVGQLKSPRAITVC